MDDVKKEILSDAIKCCFEAERSLIKYKRACLFLGGLCVLLMIALIAAVW